MKAGALQARGSADPALMCEGTFGTPAMSSLFLFLLFPLLLLIGVVLWATESRQQRIRRWHRSGQSQRAIAARLGVTRYQVRIALAAS